MQSPRASESARTATINRVPGRPSINVERVDADSAKVDITAEGLPSNDWYEALVRAYRTDSAEVVPLAAARFSPAQDGNLSRSIRFKLPKEAADEMLHILVLVQRDKVVGRADCNTQADITCASVAIASTPPPTTTTSSQG